MMPLIAIDSMVQSSQGSFQKNIAEKTFKISHMTQSFEQEVIHFQQNFLKQRQECFQDEPACIRVVQLMMQLNQQIVQSQEISKKIQSDLFSIINMSKKTLFEQQPALICDLRDQAFIAWWNFLERSLDHVQVQGYRQDFEWLCTQIGQLMYGYRLNVNAQELKTITIRSVTMCQELMQKFNGLLVNDYDLLVLANVAVALLAMRC